jgi:tetratricopeptide (TPR) repeat protein
MRLIFLTTILFTLYLTNIFGQKTDFAAKADSLTKLSSSFYDTNPGKFIELRNSAAISFEKAGNKIWQALSYQNIAFAYEEKLKKIDSAICYVNKAIPIWIEINDTNGLANILKYLGMLQGKTGDFTNAKKSINKAILLFEKEDFISGVAVSYFDLASVYENENKLDSCLLFLNKNKHYFETNQDTLRVFNTNNKLFGIYLKEKNYISAADIYEQNSKMEKSDKVYWQHHIDFYRLCKTYFEAVKNTEKYTFYSDKYKLLFDSLTSEGVIIQ